MRKLSIVEGRAYPLGSDNVDTDAIIAAAHLKTIRRTGLGRFAFEGLRRRSGSVFDDPRYRHAPILIAGANFGCGSSREHAVWALSDLGIKAIIAESFADIFASNAFKNGIATVALAPEVIKRLLDVARTDPISVDLQTMTVTTPFQDRFSFELDPFRRRCLVEGLDEIALTLTHEAAIRGYERRNRR